jgi:signal transduction histidine kinase
MNENYTIQLRTDSLTTLVPVTAAMTWLLSLLTIVAISPDHLLGLWSLWITMIGTLVVAQIVRKLVAEGARQILAANVFVAAHLLFLALVIIQMWQPGSMLPFFFAVFVVAAGMMIDVSAGFRVWVASSLLLLAAVYLNGRLDWNNLLSLLPVIFLNFCLATVSFLAAIDWKIALESVSELQLKAQQRRDELFDMKEELSLTNAKLHHLNRQLEVARQAAVDERDMRTRFMNNVSHELRTPLNAIVNFAYILFQGGRGEINEGQADYLKRIEQAGRHLLNVLNDLLDLARIESGEFKLHVEMSDLKLVCEEAMDSTRGLLLEKENEIRLIRDFPELWPCVAVDQMRLKQALINLLGNAAKYTDEGYIALRVRQLDGAVQLVVEDTGVGIAPQYHEAVFQEFRQVDDTAARRRLGTGLGLPITRHLIERHGGEITLDSDLGKGSTFTITLPLMTTGTDGVARLEKAMGAGSPGATPLTANGEDNPAVLADGDTSGAVSPLP